MAEIYHLENRHDVMFFCQGWCNLDKISQTGAEWHVDCGDMAEIETRSRIPIWRTFGRIQWHVIPEPPATLQCAATWQIQCHDPRATGHIVGCCHRANALSWFYAELHATLQGAVTWRIQWHFIPHPRVTLQGRPTATWWIHCHDPRATCHIASAVTWRNQCHDRAKLQGVRIPSAILKIVFRHILFFVFLMEFGLWRAVSFASSLIHLLSWDRTHETAELLPRISKEYSYSIEQFALTPD